MTPRTKCWSPPAPPRRWPAAIFGLVAPGDEIVLIEPHYDAYRPIAEAAGAVVKTITLSPPGWRLTAEALAAAITPRPAPS